MHLLLAPALGFKLEPYKDNRAAPKASRRREAGEVHAPEPGVRRYVDVPYKQGGRDLVQRWFYETPESINVDERQDARFRPQINRDRSEYNTAAKMWMNVCLAKPYLAKMWGEDGYINQRLDGKGNGYDHAKTSIGEGIQFLAYMLAIANNPGRPVRAMWNEKLMPGDKRVLPPPALGRFGMSLNRFFHLAHLAGFLHSKSEAELDTSDPWRYCALIWESHNAHWEEINIPSWLIGPDESMSPTTTEGDKPSDLPFLSNVPRKPKPLGCELKDTACG
eukprot:7385110-Prymnesium_polylepis.1